jgi:Carboxypeptidase regulatory-like domain
MLATENRTRSRIRRILAIALPVVGRQIRTIRVHGAILVALLGLVVSGFSQTTVSTGGIQGTVTDPSGALVTGAIVSITNTATGETTSVKTNSAGAYTFAFLKPADYVVRIEARSFKTTRLPITVKVDQTANGNATLVVGDSSETVDVSASDLQVNTIQATVQGVLTSTQIANLPVNGRNFLDLAQLEPGVQIQDGQNFDPTKAGYSSISFGGRFGRTARIEVDGADVSDETVGTTTTDIPSSAIQEFQISQSSLDMSTELTSSGSVNVTTKSGTNNYHGEAFGQFRDSSLGALLPLHLQSLRLISAASTMAHWVGRSSGTSCSSSRMGSEPFNIRTRRCPFPFLSLNTQALFLIHSTRATCWAELTTSGARVFIFSIAFRTSTIRSTRRVAPATRYMTRRTTRVIT